MKALDELGAECIQTMANGKRMERNILVRIIKELKKDLEFLYGIEVVIRFILDFGKKGK